MAHPVFMKLLHKVMPHHHHQAIIPTEGIPAPVTSKLSERDRVNRSLYALWKIKQVNHHFFPPSEQDVIDSKPLGLPRYIFRYGISTCAIFYLGHAFMNSRLTIRRAAIGVGFIALMNLGMFGAEVFFDKVKMFSRRKLAKKYMDAYGADQLSAIANPSYPIDKLTHMHNKLI